MRQATVRENLSHPSLETIPISCPPGLQAATGFVGTVQHTPRRQDSFMDGVQVHLRLLKK